VLRDSSLRSDMVREAREMVLERFSLERMCREYVDVYRSVAR